MITTSNIIDLLDAHIHQKEIAKIVGVTERTVQHIQHAKKLGRGTKRSPGIGRHHRKREKVFLKTLKENHRGSYNQHEKTCCCCSGRLRVGWQ